MALATNNTISESLDFFVKANVQVINLLTQISESFTSTSDSISVQYVDSTGVTQNFSIPTIKHLESKIGKNSKDFETIQSQRSKELNLPFFGNTVIREPDLINGLKSPTGFRSKVNWFFENFLAPLLYINIDVSGKLDPNTKNVIVKRIIVRTRNKEQENVFNNSLKNREGLNYDTVISILDTAGILYFQDEDIVTLPPTYVENRGKFNVVTINSRNQASDNTSINFKYYLNTLEYQSYRGDTLLIKTLKIGDILFRGPDTQYTIIGVSDQETSVILQLTSGNESIMVGVNELEIASSVIQSKIIDINVGFDERQIIFIKPIDPYYYIIPVNWSPGFAFYSNELTTATEEGVITLKDFYYRNVVDYSTQFLSAASDKTIPAIYGLTPDAPLLNQKNFKVTKINSHKFSNSDFQYLNDRISEKTRLTSQVEVFNQELAILLEQYEREYYKRRNPKKNRIIKFHLSPNTTIVDAAEFFVVKKSRANLPIAYEEGDIGLLVTYIGNSIVDNFPIFEYVKFYKYSTIDSILQWREDTTIYLKDIFSDKSNFVNLRISNNINIPSTTISTQFNEYTQSVDVISFPEEQIADYESRFNSSLLNDIQKQIDDLIVRRTVVNQTLNGVVDQLKTFNKTKKIETPKYNVRGFWPIPDPKFSQKTGLQEIVQFVISYRYLPIEQSDASPINQAAQVSPNVFIGNKGEERQAYFSPWTEAPSQVRKKSFDSTSGQYVWSVENVENADVVNINQLSVPITKGEKVELRIKSISEAGWPQNPAFSDWSNSVIVEFSNDLLDETDQDLVLQGLSEEQVFSLVTQQVENNTLVIRDLKDQIRQLQEDIKILKGK